VGATPRRGTERNGRARHDFQNLMILIPPMTGAEAGRLGLPDDGDQYLPYKALTYGNIKCE